MAKITERGAKAMSDSKSGVKHGSSNKNLSSGARSTGSPAARAPNMAPIKGSNKGGMC